MAKLIEAKDVEAGDKWAGMSNKDRKAWCARARVSDLWDTTTFEDLPDEVRSALEAV